MSSLAKGAAVLFVLAVSVRANSKVIGEAAATVIGGALALIPFVIIKGILER
jgi:hypothetical protein